MSHQLTERSDGRVEMFSAGSMPVWHRLGQRTDNAVTSDRALELSGLDWHVECRHLTVDHADGRTEVLRSHKATVRTDTNTTLGVVGHRYTPIQNEDAFRWLDQLTGQKLAAYETAGSIRGGRVVWMLLRLPTELRVPGTDDVTRPYLLACNSHDGSQALRVLRTAVRVVCNNTLTFALRSQEGLSLRHTTGSLARLDEAREVLGLAHLQYARMQNEMEQLARTPMTGGRLTRYFEEVWPDPVEEKASAQAENVRSRMKELFEDEPQSMPGVRGSAWAAWNAVSQFTDHERRHTGRTESTRDERRLRSIWFGDSARVKRHAWAKALELARTN